MVLSREDQPRTHSTPAEISRELNINRRSVSRMIGQDLDLCSLRERKVQKVTDSKTVKAHDSFKKVTIN